MIDLIKLVSKLQAEFGEGEISFSIWDSTPPNSIEIRFISKEARIFQIVSKEVLEARSEVIFDKLVTDLTRYIRDNG